MKDAHRLYKNDFQRRGRSWSECLKAAWSWERDARKNESVHKNEFEGLSADAVSWAMGYNRGNGFYCGD